MDVNKKKKIFSLNKLIDSADLSAVERESEFYKNNRQSWSDRYISQGPGFEDLEYDLSSIQVSTKLITYYLPQFHPFKENNEWWGNGFTEWRNVAKAKPRFDRHYQPRIPLDLGYYDLRLKDIMYQQADMAKKSGVHAWCFYHYDFGDKRLMDQPVNQFLSNKDIDMPFCIMWVNDDWKRTWGNSSNEILIKQKYGEEYDVKLVENFARHFVDERYMRLNSKPLLFIYSPQRIPNLKKKLEVWRELLHKNYQLEVLIYGVQTPVFNFDESFGLDGMIEFPPHGYRYKRDIEALRALGWVDPDFSGNLTDYRYVILNSTVSKQPDYDLIKCIVPSWDNEARKANAAHGYRNSSPERYFIWLDEMIKRSKKNLIHGQKEPT